MLTAERFWCLTAIATSLCATIGCVPIAAMDPPQVVARLSNLILEPDASCAELRDRFQVDLPVVDNPAEAGLEYQEFRVPLDDSKGLRVWYLPAESDRGTVIYSMGDAGNMACYLFSADLLTRIGWSVVMYDYEGFGGSDGKASLYALSRDLRAVIDWTRNHTGRDQVTLMGMSLGSIPSIALAVEYPEAVNGVILDSPIGLRSQIFRFGFLVAGQSGPLIDRLSPDMVSEDIISGLKQPLLIFAHGRDFISTLSSVQTLFDRAAGPKELVTYPDLGHAGAQFLATDSYLYYLEDFLTRVWPGAGLATTGE
jgi:pimeloyl-ACP methyl ester carboxylesterase